MDEQRFETRDGWVWLDQEHNRTDRRRWKSQTDGPRATSASARSDSSTMECFLQQALPSPMLEQERQLLAGLPHTRTELLQRYLRLVIRVASDSGSRIWLGSGLLLPYAIDGCWHSRW